MTAVAEKIALFKQAVVRAFDDRLACLVLTGSHAREEARPDSDIDLWLFLDDIRLPDLQLVGGIVAALGPQPELNPQCTSFAEVRAGSFREQFSPIQFHLDGQVIHGALQLPRPEPAEVLRHGSAIAAFVLMSARHYIAVREPEASLARGKLQRWVLKPLMWALRYEAFFRTGHYPRRLEALPGAVFSEAASQLVNIYRQLNAGVAAGPFMPVVESAEDVARKLVLMASRAQPGG